jgi:hypothetical protein
MSCRRGVWRSIVCNEFGVRVARLTPLDHMSLEDIQGAAKSVVVPCRS